MRKELHLTEQEKSDLLLGATIRKEKSLAAHIKKCAIKQNDEYIKYQFNDKPAPLSERMNWTPIVATKEDLISNEKL